MGLQCCTQWCTVAVSALFTLSLHFQLLVSLLPLPTPHPDRSVSISAVSDPPSPRKPRCSCVYTTGPSHLPSFRPQGPPLGDQLGFCLFPSSCILDKSVQLGSNSSSFLPAPKPLIWVAKSCFPSAADAACHPDFSGCLETKCRNVDSAYPLSCFFQKDPLPGRGCWAQ